MADQQSFIETFKVEARERLLRMNNLLVELERDPENEELIQTVMREAHTIKGSAKMVGLLEISDAAHTMEDTLSLVVEKKRSLNEVSAKVFAELDAVTAMVEGDAAPQAEDEPEELSGAEAAEVSEGGAKKAPNQADKAPGDEHLPESGGAEHKVPPKAAKAADAPPSAKPQASAKPSASRSAAGSPPSTPPQQPPAVSAPPRPKAPVISPAPKGNGAVVTAAVHTGVEETMRVSVSKLDSLINLAGESMVHQIEGAREVHRVSDLSRQLSRQHKLVRELERQVRRIIGASVDLDATAALETCALLEHHAKEITVGTKSLSRQLKESAAKRDYLSREFQRIALSVRMLPLSVVFDRFPRAVREMAREAGKDVHFVVEGGETELDKKVLDSLAGPLTHILRNAVDHGIERVAERSRLGKPKTGLVKLSACQQGDHVLVEVSDDGGGIDHNRVRELAIERGYLSESDNLRPEDIFDVIFMPGFSTSSVITDISGRGVGLDVVRQDIEALKGTVTISSTYGQSTTFSLRIPLTLAICRVLYVRAAGQILAIPTAMVEEIASVDTEQIEWVQGKRVLSLRDEVLPLVDLSNLVGFGSLEAGAGALPAIVVTAGFERIGLRVEELVGEQEVVLKHLEPPLVSPLIGGATILDTGEVVLILGPGALASGRHNQVHYEREVSTSAGQPQEAPLLLVCDDSLVTRELERSILETSGYRVDIAKDGLEGWNKVSTGDFDLAVLDVEMPGLTGLELAKKIRGDERTRDLPVIIMSSLAEDQDRQNAVEAGADAYIVKGSFNQSNLLSTVERLIGAANDKEGSA